jgi:hypothetical protein
MMFQVVLGGVGAIVLFQAMAWWVPMIDKDPFGLGPVVAQYVPAIVPKKWHGTAKIKPNQNGTDNQTTNGASAKPVNDQNSTPPRPKKNGTGGSDTSKLENLDPVIDPLGTPSKPALDPGELAIPDPLNSDPKPLPEKPMPEKPVDFTPPMPKPVDPNLKPPASTLEIKTKFAEAVLKREEFETSTADDAATRQAKGREMYDAAAELGKLCTNADWTDPDNEDTVGKIKEFAGQLKPRTAMLTFLADERLNNESGKDSIVVAGVIKDIKELGATHETTIEVARPKGTLFTVPIVTAQSLEGEGAKLGDTIMVFGRLIRDPKKDLPKYKGEAPVVVQSGATVVLPAE